MHATLCDQEQVGKPVQICIAWAWQDGLGGREGCVENVEFRVAFQKITDRNAHVVLVFNLSCVIIRRGMRRFGENAPGLKKKTKSGDRRYTTLQDCDTVGQRQDRSPG